MVYGYPYGKIRWNLDTFVEKKQFKSSSYTTYKNQLQGHYRSKHERTIKLLEGNLREYFHDLGVGKYFF